jgi:hypothetical protein
VNVQLTQVVKVARTTETAQVEVAQAVVVEVQVQVEMEEQQWPLEQGHLLLAAGGHAAHSHGDRD